MAKAYDEVVTLKDSEQMGEVALLASVKLNRLLHADGQKAWKVVVCYDNSMQPQMQPFFFFSHDKGPTRTDIFDSNKIMIG